MIAAALAILVSCPASPVVFSGSPLVVGDSVTVAAARPLHARGLGVNARGCRAMREGLSVIHRVHRHRVVLALGSNGTLTMSDLRTAHRFADELTLVTPGGRGDGDRGRMLTFAQMRSSVKVVDWYRISRSRRGLLQPDGLHLTVAGARLFAESIARVVR